MISVRLVLLILSLVCFVIGAIGVPTPRVNVTALGLAFYVLSLLVV